ncbi:hypothetical protein DENSPDRAFT_843209 [Dentipellis sp. KUC8613]|nr:hypothetical protein DENSPDRAFT_843209 [Dentipellis sp. KUC8613]
MSTAATVTETVGSVVEILRFKASEKCLTDPGVFKELRDIAGAQAKSHGLTHQFWGRLLEDPSVYFWVMFWTSFEEKQPWLRTSQESAAAHAILGTLVAEQPQATHLRVPAGAPPLAVFRAPVTELADFATSEGGGVNMDELLGRCAKVVGGSQVYGAAVEDGQRGLFVRGLEEQGTSNAYEALGVAVTVTHGRFEEHAD